MSFVDPFSRLQDIRMNKTKLPPEKEKQDEDEIDRILDACFKHMQDDYDSYLSFDEKDFKQLQSINDRISNIKTFFDSSLAKKVFRKKPEKERKFTVQLANAESNAQLALSETFKELQNDFGSIPKDQFVEKLEKFLKTLEKIEKMFPADLTRFSKIKNDFLHFKAKSCGELLKELLYDNDPNLYQKASKLALDDWELIGLIFYQQIKGSPKQYIDPKYSLFDMNFPKVKENLSDWFSFFYSLRSISDKPLVDKLQNIFMDVFDHTSAYSLSEVLSLANVLDNLISQKKEDLVEKLTDYLQTLGNLDTKKLVYETSSKFFESLTLISKDDQASIVGKWLDFHQTFFDEHNTHFSWPRDLSAKSFLRAYNEDPGLLYDLAKTSAEDSGIGYLFKFIDRDRSFIRQIIDIHEKFKTLKINGFNDFIEKNIIYIDNEIIVAKPFFDWILQAAGAGKKEEIEKALKTSEIIFNRSHQYGADKWSFCGLYNLIPENQDLLEGLTKDLEKGGTKNIAKDFFAKKDKLALFEAATAPWKSPDTFKKYKEILQKNPETILPFISFLDRLTFTTCELKDPLDSLDRLNQLNEDYQIGIHELFTLASSDPELFKDLIQFSAVSESNYTINQLIHYATIGPKEVKRFLSLSLKRKDLIPSYSKTIFAEDIPSYPVMEPSDLLYFFDNITKDELSFIVKNAATGHKLIDMSRSSDFIKDCLATIKKDRARFRKIMEVESMEGKCLINPASMRSSLRRIEYTEVDDSVLDILLRSKEARQQVAKEGLKNLSLEVVPEFCLQNDPDLSMRLLKAVKNIPKSVVQQRGIFQIFEMLEKGLRGDAERLTLIKQFIEIAEKESVNSKIKQTLVYLIVNNKMEEFLVFYNLLDETARNTPDKKGLEKILAPLKERGQDFKRWVDSSLDLYEIKMEKEPPLNERIQACPKEIRFLMARIFSLALMEPEKAKCALQVTKTDPYCEQMNSLLKSFMYKSSKQVLQLTNFIVAYPDTIPRLFSASYIDKLIESIDHKLLASAFDQTIWRGEDLDDILYVLTEDLDLYKRMLELKKRGLFKYIIITGRNIDNLKEYIELIESGDESEKSVLEKQRKLIAPSIWNLDRKTWTKILTIVPNHPNIDVFQEYVKDDHEILELLSAIDFDKLKDPARFLARFFTLINIDEKEFLKTLTKVDYDLMESLIDLAGVGYIPEASFLLEKNLETTKDPLYQKFLATANSQNGQTILEVLNLCQDNKKKAILTNLATQEPGDFELFAKSLQRMQFNSQNVLCERLFDFLEKPKKDLTQIEIAVINLIKEGELAYAEDILSLSKDIAEKIIQIPSKKLQMTLIDLEFDCEKVLAQSSDKERTIRALEKLKTFYFQESFDEKNEKYLLEKLAIVQYLLLDNRDFLVKKVEEESFKLSQLQCELDPNDQISKKMQDVEEHKFSYRFKKKESLETNLSIFLASVLVTSSGRINRPLIEHLSKLPFITETLPKDSDFLLYLQNVLQLLEEDSDFMLHLSRAKKPIDNLGPVNTMIKRMLGLKEESELSDWHAKVAVLSAILSRPRQSSGLGSCFGTQPSCMYQSTTENLLQSISDYSILIEHQKLKRTISNPTPSSVDFPIQVNMKKLGKPQLFENPLLKARENVLSSMGGFVSTLNLTEIFGGSYSIYSSIYSIIEAWITHEVTVAIPFELDDLIDMLRSTCLELTTNVAIFDQKHPVTEERGFWSLKRRDNGEFIQDMEGFRTLFEDISTFALQKMKDKHPISAPPNIWKALFGQLNDYIQSDKFPVSPESLEATPENKRKLLLHPWLDEMGGLTTKVIRNNEQREQEPKQLVFEVANPEISLRAVIELIQTFPRRDKAKYQQESSGLQYLGVPGHAMSLLPHPLMKKIEEFKDAEAIIDYLKSSVDFSKIELSDESQDKILQECLALLPASAKPPFSTTIRKKIKEAKTLDQFGKELIQGLNEALGKTADYDIQRKVEEIIFQNIPTKIAGALPFIPFGDLNWSGVDFNNIYLGYGPNLLTGEIALYQANFDGSSRKFLHWQITGREKDWQFFEPIYRRERGHISYKKVIEGGSK